jgi:hypothetical protein
MSFSDGLLHDMFRRFSARSADPLALDEATASRLLAGAIDPADAPPGYAPVAAVLAAAAAPRRPEELTGAPPTLVAAGPAHPPAPRRTRTLRLTALVGVAVVAVGGVAAAATGSLPGGVQSVAHDALGAVGVSVPAPARAHTHRSVPARRSARVVAPRRPVVPHGPSPHRPVVPRPHRTAPVPPPHQPHPRPRPAPSTVAAALCRADAAGTLSPLAAGRAGRAYRSLAGLARGAANIAAYCRGVLG